MTISLKDIDNLLPQTQCKQCGYDGCEPYAAAILNNNEKINRCPPGGEPVLLSLAKLLNQPIIPLDTTCGEHKLPQTVVIDESLCIGCTKCIQACPVDAIIGVKKKMHTILQDECTGCELCIPPCPLDCIIIKPSNEVDADFGLTDKQKNRALISKKRYMLKNGRDKKRTVITKTLPPQEKNLGERTSSDAMKAFIMMAKNRAENR